MTTPRFDDSYARLGDGQFTVAVAPDRVPNPEVVRINDALADALGFDADWLRQSGAAFLSGNELAPTSTPVATVYAGHQFGNFAGRLGDGRAHLLGEIVTPEGRFDLQLKGSGRTPYSRMGDGRSPLGPALREYVISEAMFTLGIPTTRSLAVVTTGEPVRRQTMEPGGIVARVASSHIRVGTFEYFASQADRESIELLTSYALDRHFPDADRPDGAAIALLREVAEAQAKLIAAWQLVGFIHGVMNTDNMLICGETIDYGPCAFMDHYVPGTVFSSIDHYGRYAYENQPPIAQWNIVRLATALLALIEPDDATVEAAQEVVEQFPQRFQHHYDSGMRQKLGLTEARDGDAQLAEDLLARMEAAELDFTNSFRQLTDDPAALHDSLQKWVARLARRWDTEDVSADERRELMGRSNPAVIPRNHLVERALSAANSGDFEPFGELVDVVTRPFERPADPQYTRPPAEEERVAATFCGT